MKVSRTIRNRIRNPIKGLLKRSLLLLGRVFDVAYKLTKLSETQGLKGEKREFVSSFLLTPERDSYPLALPCMRSSETVLTPGRAHIDVGEHKASTLPSFFCTYM
jgi:hypothetical protein